jgi:hypothetical protein
LRLKVFLSWIRSIFIERAATRNLLSGKIMVGRKIINKAISLLPSDRTMALQYLEELQFDLENRNLPESWINELKGFMRGIHASGLIDVASLDKFERLLTESGY